MTIYNAQRADVLVPPVSGVTSHEVVVEGRLVLVVIVPEAETIHQHQNGKILVRRGSENVALKGKALRQAWVQREQPIFDNLPVWKAGLEDLNSDHVEWYLNLAAEERGIPLDLSLSMSQNLVRLGAVLKDDDELVPKAAGVLLFAQDPQQFFPQSEVRIARFQGTSPVNFIDRLVCRGTLPEVIDEAERFVKRNTRVAARIVDFERQEVTEYPYPAIREAITNAVTHRDYWRDDARIRVSIFDDRIEVQSPGALPPPLTIETLGEDHVLRNQLLADLLFNIRYIEAWNTGIKRMRRLMMEHDLQEPIFEEVGESFRVTFYGSGEDILDLIPEGGRMDLRELGLNERQIKALRLMVNEGVEMTNRRYRELFDITSRTALRDLNELVESDQAKKVGQGRNVRYVAR